MRAPRAGWPIRRGCDPHGVRCAQRNNFRFAIRPQVSRGHIPGLLKIEVGVDIGYDPQADDVVLYSEFVDRAALDAYQGHPLHLDAKAIVSVLVTGRRAVDWQV